MVFLFLIFGEISILFSIVVVPIYIPTKKMVPCGAWVALSVECPTLDFHSSHDPRVVGSSPASDSMLSVEPAWDSLSLIVSLSLSLSLSLPLPLSPAHACSLLLKKKIEISFKSFLELCVMYT